MQARATDLRILLGAYRGWDAREAAFLDEMRTLAAASDALSRTHYAPGHFTASAFVLSPRRDALLLIFHGKLQRWLQPGGHVDPNDRDLVSAALREAREEVGIEQLELAQAAPLDVDVHEIPARKGEPAHKHYDVRFLFVAPSLAFRAGSDANAARWFALDQIDAQASDESVLRAVRKLSSCAR